MSGYPSTYNIDKAAIQSLFSSTSGNSKLDIISRLAVIDNMYSTNVNAYRGFALEEIADAILQISSNGSFSAKLSAFAANPTSGTIQAFGSLNQNLFNAKFGLNKIGNRNLDAISLISKYAYFETGCSFPIVDSLVSKYAPKVWHYCGLRGKYSCPNKSNILGYVSSINLFRSQFGNMSYDSVDCLLWTVGEFKKSNLSLILSKADFQKVVAINRNNRFDFASSQFTCSNQTLNDIYNLAKMI